MNLEILRPIKISFDLLESEDRLPSIKFKFNVEFVGMTYSFSSAGEIWVACSVLDGFVNELDVNRNSRFTSLDGSFNIEIFEKEGQVFFGGSPEGRLFSRQ